MSDQETDEQEYFPAQTAELIESALARNTHALPFTTFETKIFEELYKKLGEYMNHADIVYMISELRHDFLRGFSKPSTQNLHAMTQKCRSCKNTDDNAVLPGWNVVDPDLMIVLENPNTFGYNKDFLVDQLKKANFSSQRCMLTYLTRCPIQNLNEDNMVNCTSWLHDEIVAVNPKCILALGSKVWGSLTGDTTRKISDIESQVIWFNIYPIVPGMSLSWYSRVYESDKKNKRFENLLRGVYNFLYSNET